MRSESDWTTRIVEVFREPAWYRYYLGRELAAGELIPTGYGIAWKCWDRDAFVIMPIPLNIVASWLRTLMYAGMHGYTLDALAKANQAGYEEGRLDERERGDRRMRRASEQAAEVAFAQGVAKGRAELMEDFKKHFGITDV